MRRRFKRTTLSDHAQPVAANVLGQNFVAAAPNQRWVGDTTEFVIGRSGKLHLAAMLDLYSRFVVGWAVSALAVQLGIGSPIDLSHAPLANEGGDIIVAESGADVQGHSCRSGIRISAHLSELDLKAHFSCFQTCRGWANQTANDPWLARRLTSGTSRSRNAPAETSNHQGVSETLRVADYVGSGTGRVGVFRSPKQTTRSRPKREL